MSDDDDDNDDDHRKRAYTDLLTGSMHLLDIPAKALFKYLVEGKLPRIFLPSFLHEATHFWCMASDLGAALALLELRAHRALDNATDSGVFDRNQLLHDFGVTRVAQQLLRPLLEGMALFQEFDAAPGDSNVASLPGYWATRLFRQLGEDPQPPEDQSKVNEWLNNEIRSTLMRYRVGGAAAHRKTGVLMRSLSDDPHNYLAGYLTVKRIWINAAHRTPAFRDRDLFLTFLHSWVFHDWELIDHVVDPDLNCGAAAYFLSERLQTRLIQLADTSLDEEAAVFDREKSSADPDDAALLRGLHISPDVALEAQERVQELLAETVEGAQDKENWTFADTMTLRHRQEMMRLAIEPVQIEVNEHDRVLVRKGPGIENVYVAGPAPPEAGRGTTPGWITAYFLPEHMATVVLAVRPNQPMLWIDVAELPEDTLTVLRFAVTKVAATEAERRKLTALGREIAAGLKDDDYDLTLLSLPSHVRKVYTGYALGLVPEERMAEVEALLSRKGLYDLLGKDGDLLTALVELSLLPQPVDLGGHGGQFLRKSLADSGVDLDAALAGIRGRQAEIGMTLIASEGDLIWSAV